MEASEPGVWFYHGHDIMSTRERLHKQDIAQTRQVNSFETFTRR